jgi:hypothetical protein
MAINKLSLALLLALSPLSAYSLINPAVVVVKESDKVLVGAESEKIKFENSYFFATAKNTIDLNINFNKKRFSGSSLKQISQHILLNNATYLIHLNDDDKIDLYGLPEKSRKPIVIGKDISAPEENTARWLSSQIGFDAIVEKTKGTSVKAFILTPKDFEKGANAVLVQDSAGKISLKQVDDSYNIKEDKSGFGLLSLRSIKGNSGVFKVVFLKEGVKDIPINTKMRIERK